VDELRSDKFWLAVLGLAVIVSAAAALLLGQAEAGRALVYRDGALIESIDLSNVPEPYAFSVGGPGFNVIEVERGRIRVSDADCSDRFCVRQGWASGGAVPIVCLPHRLVIMLEGGATTDLDAVVG